MNKFLSIKEAAKHLGVSPQTLRRWERSGKISPAYRTEGNQRRYDPSLLRPFDKVQSVIRRHHVWLSKCWTLTKESYAGHGQFIVDSDLRKAYEAYHPRLPEFIAEAIQVFADKELN
jgi:excisionase family DNA binding protein